MKFNAATYADLEFRTPAEMRCVQDALLQQHIAYLAEHSEFYRRIFAECGIAPGSIRGAADLSRLPLTAKADLERCPADFLCVAPSAIVDLCLTSGTTGKPVTLAQTRADLNRLGYNEEISFRATGLDENDRVIIAAALDRCFMAGLAYFLGLERLGAASIRVGSSSVPLLCEMVLQQQPSAIVGVPTLLRVVARALQAAGHDPQTLGVKRLICIGEPVRCAELSLSALGQQLHELWGAQVFGTYASTELATAFTDCCAQQGGHLHPELIVLELLDEAGRPVAAGETGEVVVTPLGVTGMPLLRFRTGDMAVLHEEPCACGRRSPRLGPILGRKSQMLKIRGVTVYPPAIFAVLQGIEAVNGYYLEVHNTYQLSDRVRVVVGADAGSLSADAVAEQIAARTRVKPEVMVVSPEDVRARTLQETKRKPVHFFDLRNSGG
ncbi:MAG: AMP-binding protein [Desulfuromonadaceae bacterium]|nr:AMP-binding protein [Desulfuromonadaceae bacterium]